VSQGDDGFELVDHLLGEQQMQHFEMAEMVGEYRQMLRELRDRPDDEAAKLARRLPGARYHVARTYVRENWLKLEAELRRMFPEE